MAEYEKFEGHFKSIHEKLDTIAQTQTRMSEQLRYTTDMAKKHDSDINGNGKDGLKTRLGKMEVKIAFLTTGISLIVSGTTAYIVNLFKGK